MNKIHRLIWSARQGRCVVVSEVTGAAGARRGTSLVRRTRRLRAALAVSLPTASAVAASLAAALGVLVHAPAAAQTVPAPTTLPTGGQVVQGQASLRGAGNATAPVLNIDQSSQRAVINWSTFNLGSAATVNFNQPNAQSATLNRVQDVNPSRIFGHINAPGQVTLMNPNGVYFSPGAVLDVGALTATTMQQSDADFMAGGASFTRGGSTGSVVNAGTLQAGLGGYIALLAPEVRNEGLIVARQGTVALASGEAIKLNFDPSSRLTSLTVTPSQIAALVENKTAVQVGGGQILLSATAVSGLQGSVVNSGQLGASSLVSKGGRIVLEGDAVTLAAGSAITATGATGGGTVLVGGDWQGAAGTYQATTVTMAPGASIDASATQQGDGGRVVLWSDVQRAASVTSVGGRITAKGIASGGQVETSGHTVVLDSARIDAGGQAHAGLWLIDPYNYTIDAGEAATIAASLSSGTSVTVDTSANVVGEGSSGNSADAGNIDVNSSIAKIGGVDATLTLRAHNDIVVASAVAIGSTSNRLNVVFNSDQDAIGGGAILMNSGSSITSNGGNITLGGGTAGDGSGNAVGGSTNVIGVYLIGTTLNAGAGNISVHGMGGSNAATKNNGLNLTSGTQIVSSGGNITLVGTGGGIAGSGDNDGIRIADVTIRTAGSGNLSIQGTGGVGTTGNTDGVVVFSSLATIETASGNLTITGTGNGPGTDGDGIYLRGTTVRSGSGSIALNGSSGGSGLSEGVVVFGNTQVLATAGGNIAVNGIGGGTGGAADGVLVSGSTVDASSGSVSITGTLASGSSGGSNAVEVTSSSVVHAAGALSLTGNASGVAGADGVDLSTSASLATSSASPITITTDSYRGDGTESVSAGTGTVTVRNLTAGTLIDLGGADVAGVSPLTLGLTNAELARITAGKLVVGRNDATAAGAVTVSSAITPASDTDLTLKTGAGMAINAPITLGSNRILTLTAAGHVSQAVGGNIIAPHLLLNGSGNYALATAGGNAITDIAATGTGSVSFLNGSALQIGTVDGVSGIAASGPVDIGTASGDLTVAQSVTTTNTGSSAVRLNAGVGSAAGTASGGNIMFSGNPAITTGGGGRATLYTGSVAGSTGLSAFVGSGSGHFRYNSDEVASNFSPALSGGGNYAIYREQPTLTLTGSSATITYGSAAPGSLATLNGGALNGDSITLGSSIGGATSTSGQLTAGSHVVTPLDLSGLGYATSATTGTLTVNPKAVTVSGLTATGKVYDGNTVAAVNVGGAVIAGLVSGDVVNVSATGAFADKNIGIAKTVTLTSGHGGADAGNYSFTDQATTTADITPKGLTVTGTAAASKVYDRTTAATLSGGSLVGVVGGDVVTLAQAGSFASVNVGTGIAVTASNSLGGAGAGNYTLAQPTGLSADITPKTLTMTGLSSADKVYDGNTTAIVNGTATLLAQEATGAGSSSDGRSYSGDTLSLVGTAAGTFDSKDVASATTVGFGGLSLGGAQAGNYLLNSGSVAQVITPKALTVSGSSAARKVYDRTTTATVTGGALAGVVAGDTVTLAQAGSFGSANVGTAIAVITSDSLGGAQAGNYSLTQPGGLAADITPKALTVSGITAADKVYDATTAATISTAGAGYAGLIAGDTVTVSATGSFGDKDVGSGKAVNLASSYGGADRGNYSITGQAAATASITPKALTVSGLVAADKVYDANTAATVSAAGATYTGLIAGDAVSVAATGAFSDKNVGNGKPVNLTSNYSGADLGNYAITDQTTSAANITPAALTVTANADARLIARADTAGYNGASYTGLVGGETPAVLTGTLAITRPNAATDVAAATYAGALVPSGYSSGNYSISYANGNYTIVPAQVLLIRAANASVVYGSASSPTISSVEYLDADNTTIYTLTGSGSGNSFTYTDGLGGGASFVLTPSGAATSTAGKTVVGNFAWADASPTVIGANFGSMVFVGNLSVTPKTIGATASSVAKVYDGTTAMTGVTLGLAGKETNDVLTVSGTGAFSQKGVGSALNYTISGLALGGADAGNYLLGGGGSFVGSDGAITPKAISVSGITAANKVYDGTTAATVTTAGASFAGLVAGDNVSVAATGAFGDKNVANGKTVTLASSYGGADLGNYSITGQASATADITPAALSVSGITATGKVYDGGTSATVSSAGASFAGLIAGDTVSVNATGAFANKNTGNGKTVILASSYGGADAGNYSITDQAATSADITPKALVVSGITAADKVYDGGTTATVATTGASYAGLVAGDVVTVGASGVFGDKNAGSAKTVTLASSHGGVDAGNYSITDQASTTADITPKALSVAGTIAADKVYDRTTAATVSGGPLVGVVGSDAVTLTQAGAFASANAGTGIAVTTSDTLSGADAGNYLVTSPSGLAADITPKSLSVTGTTVANKVYDKTTTAALSGGTLAGLIAGDSVSLTQAGDFATVNAGTQIAVTASDSLGGAAAGNYVLAQPTGLAADITPRPLALVGDTGLDKTYDGHGDLTAAGHGALPNALPGDSVQLQGLARYASPNAGAQAIVRGSLSLGGASAGNYSLAWTDGSGTIAPAALTVFANNDARFVVQADAAGYNGVSYSGFVNGETSAVLLSSAVIARSNLATNAAGEYAGVLVPSGASAANYAITFVAGSYTIVPANQLLVRLPNVESTYGSNVTYGPAQASYLAADNTTIVDLSSAVTAVGNALTVTDGASGTASFTVAPMDARFGGGGALAVGSYQLGAGQVTATSANFSNKLVVVGAHQVDPKGITLAVGGASKVYDGTVAMPGLQLAASGLVPGDSATPAGTGEFASRNAGTGLAYSVTGVQIAGADAGNYYVIGGSSISGTDGVITPKPVTLTAPVVSKVYDGSAQYTPDAATLAALSQQLGVPGDSLTGISLVFADKNVTSGGPLTPSGAAIADGNGGGNYAVSYADSQGNTISRLPSVTWVGGATGNWFDPANWAGGAVPDLANVANVVIPQNVTVSFGPTVVGPAQAGPVHIDSLGTAGALDMQAGQLIVGTGGVTLGAITQSGGSVSSAGPVTLGSFTQNGGSFATDGNFGTTNQFAQAGPGTLAVGGGTQIVDTGGGTTLGNIDSTGPLSVTSSGGAITQQPGTVVTARDSSSLTATNAGAPADITLPGANQLTGPVSASGANVTLTNAAPLTLSNVTATGNLAVRSQGALNLGTSQVGGNLTAASGNGDITSSGPVKVGGRTLVDAGTGHVRLLDHGNTFGGTREGHGTTVRIYPFDEDAAPVEATDTGAEISGAIQAGLAAEATAARHATRLEAGCGPTMQLDLLDGAVGERSPPIASIGQAVDNSSFEFELPALAAHALRAQAGKATARRADGSSLPAWLMFDAERLRLHGLAVPTGGLPIELAVQASGEAVRLTIAKGWVRGTSCKYQVDTAAPITHAPAVRSWAGARPCGKVKVHQLRRKTSMNDTTSAASQSLGKIVGEAESLLDKAGEIGTKEYNSAIKKAAEQLRRAQAEFIRLEEAAVDRAKAAARVTDNAVHEHPYTAVGVAAAVGLLLGILISRR